MKLSVWDVLAIILFIASIAMLFIFAGIYDDPYGALNPFPPPTLPSLLVLPTASYTPYRLPATWTPTGVGAIPVVVSGTIRPSATPQDTPTGFTIPTSTDIPTDTPTPTETPLPTKTRTVTPVPTSTPRPTANQTGTVAAVQTKVSKDNTATAVAAANASATAAANASATAAASAATATAAVQQTLDAQPPTPAGTP